MKAMLLIAVLVSIVCSSDLTAQNASTAKGVFSLTPADKAIARAGVLDNANVDGVSIRTHWDALETADGTYNWTYVDGQVSRCVAAGKQISLRVGTGSGDATRGNGGTVPGWVIDQMVTANGGTANDNTHFFHFNDASDGVPDRAIPTFWDRTFVSKKREMLTALGIHFAGNNNIKIVYVGFSNAQSMDWSVRDSKTVDGLGATGSSERSRWLALGYTAQKVIDAGCPASGTTGIIDAAAFAFPNATIVYAVGRNSAASNAPSMSGLDPTKDYVAQTVLNNAIAKYGNRIGIQKDNLSALTASKQPYSGQPGANNFWTIIYNNPTRVGAQMVSSTYPDGGSKMNGGVFNPPSAAQILTTAVDAGIAYHTKYQEIYQIDVINLPAVISYAHSKL